MLNPYAHTQGNCLASALTHTHIHTLTYTLSLICGASVAAREIMLIFWRFMQPAKPERKTQRGMWHSEAKPTRCIQPTVAAVALVQPWNL